MYVYTYTYMYIHIFAYTNIHVYTYIHQQAEVQRMIHQSSPCATIDFLNFLTILGISPP